MYLPSEAFALLSHFLERMPGLTHVCMYGEPIAYSFSRLILECAREKILFPPTSLTFIDCRLPGESLERSCSNPFAVALEVARLNLNGLTSLRTKTERFVVRLRRDRVTLIHGCTELPGPQYQRADGPLAKEQGRSLVHQG